MHENSLFAILWRSPWWVSGAVAMAVIALAKIALPAAYVSYGFVVALPFAVITLLAAWKQLRQPGAGRVAESLELLRAMSWDDFSAAVDDAFRRDGYEVRRLAGAGADFELVKLGRVTLVGAKRWKAARTGVEPLRELYAGVRAGEAAGCFYLSAGEISDNARAFAAEMNIRLVQGAELAKFLPRQRPAK